jgi:8-oxo-dGTP pyrophosphatase MutT (NUDIX family)
MREGMRMASKAKKASDQSSKAATNKSERAIRIQHGVLPYRFTPTNALEVLLVTTRRTRRWIIPKGWPIKGLKPPKSAAREAFEEAGVRGKVGAKSIGGFSYQKSVGDSDDTVPCEVRVFPMLVTRQLNAWPEAHERTAEWFVLDNALSVIEFAGLRTLISSFAKRKLKHEKPTLRSPSRNPPRLSDPSG